MRQSRICHVVLGYIHAIVCPYSVQNVELKEEMLKEDMLKEDMLKEDM